MEMLTVYTARRGRGVAVLQSLAVVVEADQRRSEARGGFPKMGLSSKRCCCINAGVRR